MSKICEASRRLAASPLVATSTLWPSLRKLISSSSQMERSSSTISRWAIALCLPHERTSSGFVGHQLRSGAAAAPGCARDRAARRKFDDEFGAVPLLGLDANLAAVRLQNLIDDGQTQPGAALKSGLKRLENSRRPRAGRCPCRYRESKCARFPGPAPRLTVSTPPSGMARSALLHRFQNTCLMASRSTRGAQLS